MTETHGPCSSSLEVPTPSLAPTKLLRLAIKKRKALLAEKDADMRKKLLLSATIQSLCRHIGEARAARRRTPLSDFASTADGPAPKLRRHSSQPELRPASIPLPPSEPPTDTKKTQTSPPDSRRKRALSDSDPFGLDEFFSSLKSVKLR